MRNIFNKLDVSTTPAPFECSTAQTSYADYCADKTTNQKALTVALNEKVTAEAAIAVNKTARGIKFDQKKDQEKIIEDKKAEIAVAIADNEKKKLKVAKNITTINNNIDYMASSKLVITINDTIIKDSNSTPKQINSARKSTAKIRKENNILIKENESLTAENVIKNNIIVKNKEAIKTAMGLKAAAIATRDEINADIAIIDAEQEDYRADKAAANSSIKSLNETIASIDANIEELAATMDEQDCVKPPCV